MTDYSTMKLWDLGNRLRERNLPTTGIKVDLMRRLQEDDRRKERLARRLQDPRSKESRENQAKQAQLAAELRNLHEEENDPDGVGRAKTLEKEYWQRKREVLANKKTKNGSLEKLMGDKKIKIDKLEQEIKSLGLDIRKMEKKMKDNTAKFSQDDEKVEDSFKSMKIRLEHIVKQEKDALKRREDLCSQYNDLNPPNVRAARLEDFAPTKEPLPKSRQSANTEQKVKASSPTSAKASSEARRTSMPSEGPKYDLKSPGKLPSRPNATNTPTAIASSHRRVYSSAESPPPAKRRLSESCQKSSSMGSVAAPATRPDKYRSSNLSTPPDKRNLKEAQRRKSGG